MHYRPWKVANPHYYKHKPPHFVYFEYLVCIVYAMIETFHGAVTGHQNSDAFCHVLRILIIS